MVKYKCQICDMVVLYIPRHGSSGHYRKATPLQKTTDAAGAHNPEGRVTNPANLPEEKPAPKAMPKAKPKSGYPPEKPDKKDPRDSKNKKDGKDKKEEIEDGLARSKFFHSKPIVFFLRRSGSGRQEDSPVGILCERGISSLKKK